MIKVRTHLIVLAAALTSLLFLPAAAAACGPPECAGSSTPAASRPKAEPLQRLRRTRAKRGSSQRIPDAAGACRRGFDSGPNRSYDNDPARLSTLPPRVPDSGQMKRRVAA